MKTKKTATIVAMSATIAMQAAIADMKAEFGDNYIPMTDGTVINYTYDPFEGMWA